MSNFSLMLQWSGVLKKIAPQKFKVSDKTQEVQIGLDMLPNANKN